MHYYYQNFPSDIFFPSWWTHAGSKEDCFQRWPVCPQTGSSNSMTRRHKCVGAASPIPEPCSSDPNSEQQRGSAGRRSKAESYSQGGEYRVGAARSQPFCWGQRSWPWAGSSPHYSLPPSQCCEFLLLGQGCSLFPNLHVASKDICDEETLRIELHTWLTPQQSRLLRIRADPRMFSLKTEFSDRLSKHFPCIVSSMMGQNYTKHMGLTLPSATRGSLPLDSVTHFTYPSWVCKQTLSCSVLFHAPSGRRKTKRLVNCFSASIFKICHRLPLRGGIRL